MDSCVYITLPVLDESENIEALLCCLRVQEYSTFKIVVCVNQYDGWWDNPEKKPICIDNQRSIELIKSENSLDIHVIDRSSRGKGWPDKKGGVGWARKTIMDYVSNKASDNDIIVSIDADTYYPPDYIQKLVDYFKTNKMISGISIPYYHRLAGDVTDRLILRYELYMRFYLLNMFRINNPYCFTALGSAMAFPVWAYKKAGGLTPVPAGEDFYFLQKLVKTGIIGLWTSTIAYPSPRFSGRVTFGTGPALIKGNEGNWTSYPHYRSKYFDDVGSTYMLFNNLFENEVVTPMDHFLKEQFKTTNVWEPLRKNYKDLRNFRKACTNKVDGLRILQYLRKQNETNSDKDEIIMREFLMENYESELPIDLLNNIISLDYQYTSIETLEKLRFFLFEKEQDLRQERIVNFK